MYNLGQYRVRTAPIYYALFTIQIERSDGNNYYYIIRYFSPEKPFYVFYRIACVFFQTHDKYDLDESKQTIFLNFFNVLFLASSLEPLLYPA